MRLCFITHDVQLYGANKSLLALLLYLDRACPEFQLNVFVPGEGAFTQALEKEGIPCQVVSYERTVYAVDRQNMLSRLRLGIQFLTGTWRLLGQIKKFRPDLIYTNSSVIANGFPISKLLGVPHIWHIREFGLEHYGLLPIWGPTIQSWLYRKSDRLIFVSMALREAICDSQLRVKAEVVYNGIDSPVSHTEEKGDLHTACTFCFIGFLSKQKNVVEAILLLQQIRKQRPNAVLHICGSGHASVEKECKEMARELGISDQVIFHGQIDDVGRVLSLSHFLIMPSRNEAMGRVTAEALMHGVPVIGRNSGGTPELLEDGTHGFLYTDVDEVACRVLALSKPEYEAMRQQARTHAVKTFSLETYGGRILQIIEKEGLV